MHLRIKLILATLAAAALLATGVSGATARNLSVNERNFELIWSEALGSPKTKIEFIASAAGVNVQCRLTLLGRWNERTIKKETASDQGTLNHGEIESCTGGTASLKTETMPWGIRYAGFEGTLPRIRSTIDAIIRIGFRVREPGGLECEDATEVNHPAKSIDGNSTEAPETGLETTGEPENIAMDRSARIPLRGEFLCAFAGEGEFGGIGLIRNLPRTAKVRLTLI